MRSTHLSIFAVLAWLHTGEVAAFSPYPPPAGYPGGWGTPTVPVYYRPQLPPPGSSFAYRYGYTPLPATRFDRGQLPRHTVPRDERAAPAISRDVETPTNLAPAPGTEGDAGAAANASRTAFFDRLMPLIEAENRRLRALRRDTRRRLEGLAGGRKADEAERATLAALAQAYRVDGDVLTDADARRELLRKVDEVPASLALAQAANESAWGTSRFAREGNNLFGIWTFDESKGIVPLKRSPGKKHLVRRFDSEAESIRYYMHTLNSHPAYKGLRTTRARMRADGSGLDGHALADGLEAYSAKGDEYVRLIRQIIERYDLAAFDAGGRTRA